MFFVFNREKIGSYIVLLSIVVILFGLAVSMSPKNSVETSVNTQQYTTNILNNNSILYE